MTRHGVWVRAMRVVTGLALATCLIAAAIACLGSTGDAVRDGAGLVSMLGATALVAMRASCAPLEHRGWHALAIAMLAWSAGFGCFLFVQGRAPDVFAFSDVIWAATYPAWYAGVLWLARDRIGGWAGGRWLDGAIGALAAAALASGLVLEATRETLGVLPGLTYALGDLLLLGFLVASLAAGDWRLSSSGAHVCAGILVLVIADALYLLELSAYPLEGTPGETLWPVGMALLARAAWRPHALPATGSRANTRALTAPVLFAAVALAVIVAGALAGLTIVAVLLAVASLALALVRLLLALRASVTLEEASRLSLIDELTGLANRRGFLVATERLVAPAGDPCALLLLDLDQFKELNDTLGHQAGDALLRELGPRLAACAGAGSVVGRLGGDEFGVLVPRADAARAVVLAERIRAALAAPFAVEGIEVQAEGSVGIALHPQDGADVSTLLRHADLAMYEAKRLRGGHALYAPSETRPTRDELGLGADVRAALAEGQLTLRYQPIVDLRTCRVRSAEALVRWDHPERGELAPGAFLRAVERAGLVREMTRAILDQAIAQLAAWQAPGATGWGVGVNVTATDLLDLGFVDEVATMLRRHGAPPHRLKLEITEGILLTDPTRAAIVLSRLRDLGVSIALDDFGTGYSSLTHLQRMPVDALKVDRSFVGPMTGNPAAAVIVRSVVGLAHALDLQLVVAEGVEDAATWRALAALGCDAAQGYLLSRPLRVPELEAATPAIEARAREAAVTFELGVPSAPPRAVAGPGRRTAPSA